MRTPAVLLIFIVLATMAQAATVTLLSNQFYEATTPWVILDVDNRGFAVVSAVTANSTLPVLQAANYSGWNTLVVTPFVSWTNGSIEGNVRSALFEYQVRTPLVTQNNQITIETRLDGFPMLLNVTVLNDNTAPVITLIDPVGSVGPALTTVIINATDPETGVANVTYKFGPCSGAQQTIPLALALGLYTGTANMTGLVEGNTLCYTINATNNAGETATQSGQLTVDATAPAVQALAPTGFTDEMTTFTVFASDNLAPSLDCQISIDGNNVGSLSVANNTQNSTTIDLSATPEGAHIWRATCADQVGLTATALQNLVLDTQAPQITLNAPATIQRTQNATASATVTDTIGLTTVNATFDGDPLALSQNGNVYTATIASDTLGPHILAFNAVDNAGHVTTKTATVTVVANHVITLSIQPTQSNPSGQVTATGTITPEGALAATSIILTTPSANQTVNLSANSFSTTFNAPASDGTYTIRARFTENNHTYSATATLVVGTGSSSNFDPPVPGSNGIPVTRRSGGGSGGGGGGSASSQSDASGSSASEATNSQDEDSDNNKPQPAPAEYQPIDADEPRRALIPGATGVFSLHPSVKWLALFIALFALAGLGAYAYHKRQPPQPEGINWDQYFER